MLHTEVVHGPFLWSVVPLGIAWLAIAHALMTVVPCILGCPAHVEGILHIPALGRSIAHLLHEVVLRISAGRLQPDITVGQHMVLHLAAHAVFRDNDVWHDVVLGTMQTLFKIAERGGRKTCNEAPPAPPSPKVQVSGELA